MGTQLDSSMLHLDFSVHGSRYNDDKYSTTTSRDQDYVEDNIAFLLDPARTIEFHREKHIQFLLGCLKGLSHWFTSLDASKPWFIHLS